MGTTDLIGPQVGPPLCVSKLDKIDRPHTKKKKELWIKISVTHSNFCTKACKINNASRYRESDLLASHAAVCVLNCNQTILVAEFRSEYTQKDFVLDHAYHSLIEFRSCFSQMA